MNTDHPRNIQIPALKALWKEAFGDTDAFIDSFFSTAFAPERCLCTGEGAEAAAAAYWFDVELRGMPAAYIYAVATAKAHRGKGLCAQLMDRIHTHLDTLGYTGTILVPGDEGLRNMYGTMGYSSFSGIDCFCRDANGTAQIREISPEEYAILRRKWLPEGAVVQEKENLNFLRQHYRFYRGEDFLLTATVADGALFAPEYWGSLEQAGGIVAALGAKKGSFRTSGSGAFAMYRPLKKSVAPTYFGFAFD